MIVTRLNPQEREIKLKRKLDLKINKYQGSETSYRLGFVKLTPLSTYQPKSSTQIITMFPLQAKAPLSLPLFISFLQPPAADLFSKLYKRQSTRNYIFSVDTERAR